MKRNKNLTGLFIAMLFLLTMGGCGPNKQQDTTMSTEQPAWTDTSIQMEPTQVDVSARPEPTPGTDGSPEADNEGVSVLFVGNSFVFTGDVPERIRVFAKMYGMEMEYETICPGGATLSQTKRQAIKKMRNETFDYAVFQDYGTRPIEEEQEFLNDVKELCDEAKKSGAKPVLYNPAWANIDGKPDKEYQDLETKVYEQAAEMNDAILVNAGDAWVYAYQKIPDISLYSPGDYHANQAGACLTACVFASTLFDLHVKDFYEGQYFVDRMIELGQAAWEFVSHYKENGKSPTKVVTVPPGTNEKVTKY